MKQNIENAKKGLNQIFYIVKILFFEAVIIMVALGFLYITNFTIRIEPKVTVISPIGGVK